MKSTMLRSALALGLTSLFAMSAAHADEDDVRKGIEAFFAGNGPKIESIRKLAGANLYEVQVDGDLIYTDDKAAYLLIGDVVETKTRKNLTDERRQKLAQVKFSDLPLEFAIKQVKGNGKRVLATFEDPNCGYCKKLAKELQGVNNVTVYTFVYPILSADSGEKAKNLWCASDRVKAWNDLMLKGSAPAAANCDHPTEKVTLLGRKLGVRGTPTMIFADGSRLPGYVEAAKLEKALDAGSASALK